MNNRTELYFSVPAQAGFDRLFNDIEASIQPGGEFCKNRDYASKVAENIARAAGIMHAFEGYDGNEISEDTLNSAATIVLWYSREFVGLFSPPGPMEVINGYARLLDQFLIEFKKSTGQGLIAKSDLLQLGPNKIRPRDIMDIAIQRLTESNRVWMVIENPPPRMDGKMLRKGKQFVYLNDAYYGQIARGIQPWGFAPL
jgi:hypothetical protein